MNNKVLNTVNHYKLYLEIIITYNLIILHTLYISNIWSAKFL